MIVWNPSWLAIILSLVAVMGLGMLWYSPVLFGNLWMKGMKLTPDDFKDFDSKAMMVTQAKGILFSLIMLVSIDILFDSFGGDYNNMWALIILLWAGFLLQGHVKSYLWQHNSLVVFVIAIGYEFASLMLTLNIFHLLN